MVIVLSNGAIVVLATAPATAPAASEVNILVRFDTPTPRWCTSKYLLWKLILVLSNGAIVVLATAPATAPAASEVNIFVRFDTPTPDGVPVNTYSGS